MIPIFTINGYMGDLWTGPQAECGVYLSNQALNLAYWQPVGYNSGAFPLSTGVTSGLAEFRRLRALFPGPYLIAAWSEGAIIATLALKAELAAGNTDCKGGAFYGNPYRAAGQWNPSGTALGAVPDPGGAGVGGPKNNWQTPATIHHYCHGPNQPSYDGKPGTDQYTCCSTGTDGDIARIFYNFVFLQWTGAFEEILLVAEEFASNAGVTLFEAIKTAVEWITFFGSKTGPHVDYDSYAGKTYLAGVARSLQ
jgi:hypothetical protein